MGLTNKQLFTWSMHLVMTSHGVRNSTLTKVFDRKFIDKMEWTRLNV